MKFNSNNFWRKRRQGPIGVDDVHDLDRSGITCTPSGRRLHQPQLEADAIFADVPGTEAAARNYVS